MSKTVVPGKNRKACRIKADGIFGSHICTTPVLRASSPGIPVIPMKKNLRTPRNDVQLRKSGYDKGGLSASDVSAAKFLRTECSVGTGLAAVRLEQSAQTFAAEDFRGANVIYPGQREMLDPTRFGLAGFHGQSGGREPATSSSAAALSLNPPLDELYEIGISCECRSMP